MVPDLHLPAAGADPHPQRQRQVAGRDRSYQPALAAPRRTPPGIGLATGDLVRVETRHRTLRCQGLGHRGDQAGGGRPAAHHMGRWKLDDDRTSARTDGDGRALQRDGDRLGDPPQEGRHGAVQLSSDRRHLAHLVDRCRACIRTSPFGVQPGPACPAMHCWHQAVRIVGQGPPRRPLRRHLGRHRKVSGGVSGLAQVDPVRGRAFARRHPAALVAASPGEAGAGGVQPSRGGERRFESLRPRSLSRSTPDTAWKPSARWVR